MVVDALTRLSIGNTNHVEEEMRNFAKDVHNLASLRVRLMIAQKEA